MPSETVTFIVSTGIGFSVIAGIVSGVCYVLAHRIRRERNRKSSTRRHCPVCGIYLSSINAQEVERVIKCAKCQKRVCKRICSTEDQVRNEWICLLCLNQSNSWLQGVLKSIRLNYNSKETFSKMSTERLDEIDEDLEAIRKKEKEQVRDFIERLVTTMLGGTIDDVSVTKLYNDKEYDALFTRYHQDLSNSLTDLGSALHISIANLPVSGQSPCTAHTALKTIIQRLLKESLDFPNLKQVENPTLPTDESNRTYEDLLATAILNKVINSCQQNNLPSSSAASVSSQISTSSKHKNDKEYFFGEETLDNKWKNTDLDTSSISSLEEWLQSDSSLGSTKYVDRVSLTIQQRIEEVSPSDSENEEDYEYFRNKNQLLLNEDDSNWYLRKRKFQGTHSPVPVPMLVPNPTTEAKVLIGEKEVEDTSDLSDAGSDYGDIESAPNIKNLLIESKMVIGGKNVLDSLKNEHLSDESSADSGVRDDKGDLDEETSYVDQPKADITIDDENVEDSSIHSNSSQVEKDSEYTERYASLPRTVTKSPPIYRPIPTNFEIPEKQSLEKTEDLNELNENFDSENEEEFDEFDGVYSKREKEKWKNPIEMRYNPYSKENIEKRIKSKSTSFGRDYYMRQASLPSGARKKPEENEVKSPIYDSKFLFENNNKKSASNEDIYRAIPTTTVDDVDEVDNQITPTIQETDNKSINIDEQNISEITSDSDLSYVNCYDVENSKIYKQTSNGSPQELSIEVNMEGLLYNPKDPDDILESLSTENSQIITRDENYNLTEESNLLKNSESEDVVVPKIKPRVFASNLKTDKDIIQKTPIAQKRNKVLTIPDNIPAEITTKKDNTPSPKIDSFYTPPTILNKKSDNTLIKRIYSDLRVRNFALTNREQIPVQYDDIKTPSVEAKQKIVEKKIITNEPPIQDNEITSALDQVIETHRNLTLARTLSSTPYEDEFSSDKNTFSLDLSDDEILLQRPGSSNRGLPEICELKEKRLVANRLGQFSKSFPNLSSTAYSVKEDSYSVDIINSDNDSSTNFTENFMETQISVKDLKKKFECNDVKHKKDKPMYSLTARSISKPMREQLRNQDSLEEIFAGNDDGIQEICQQAEIEDLPLITEDRIKFYELLRK